jgi:uncharacterized membrane protein YedE/YeeE
MPIDRLSTPGMALAVVFGLVFGLLLHRGGVTDYNVIVNQFRLRDFTVVKIMLTAVVVGGIGVGILHAAGLANFHIKPMLSWGVILGAVLFGIGMVVYGYCPGTGVAAIGTGSLHALAGFGGMLAGGIAFALSYPWLQEHVLAAADAGKIRLPDVIPLPGAVMLVLLAVGALALFAALERRERRGPGKSPNN